MCGRLEGRAGEGGLRGRRPSLLPRARRRACRQPADPTHSPTAPLPTAPPRPQDTDAVVQQLVALGIIVPTSDLVGSRRAFGRRLAWPGLPVRWPPAAAPALGPLWPCPSCGRDTLRPPPPSPSTPPSPAVHPPLPRLLQQQRVPPGAAAGGGGGERTRGRAQTGAAQARNGQRPGSRGGGGRTRRCRLARPPPAASQAHGHAPHNLAAPCIRRPALPAPALPAVHRRGPVCHRPGPALPLPGPVHLCAARLCHAGGGRRRAAPGRAGLRWAALGCAGPRWTALDWAGLRWAALGCAGPGWAGLGCAGRSSCVRSCPGGTSAGAGPPADLCAVPASVLDHARRASARPWTPTSSSS